MKRLGSMKGRAHLVRGAAALLVLVTVTVGCSQKPQRSVTSFCSRLRSNQKILSTRLTDPSEVQPVLDRFKLIDAVAPEQIRDQWHDLTVLVEKVATTTDVSTDGQNDLLRLALATEQSITAVTAYAREKCQVDIGGVTAAPATTAVTVAG
jgi:hypothetical protein